MSVDYRCPHCGTRDIVCDAWVSWNESGQVWDLDTIHGDLFCRECEETLTEGECRVEVEPTLQEAYEVSRQEYRTAKNQPQTYRGREDVDYRK